MTHIRPAVDSGRGGEVLLTIICSRTALGMPAQPAGLIPAGGVDQRRMVTRRQGTLLDTRWLGGC